MTAFKTTPLLQTRTFRDVLRRGLAPAAARDLQPRSSSRPLPLYEALAIGLGCNIGNLERFTRQTDAEAARRR